MSEGKMTSQQVLQLAIDYRMAADYIADFRHDNIKTLSSGNIKSLDDAEVNLRELAKQLRGDAAELVWEDIDDAVNNIRDATDKMRSVETHLTNIQRAISFAAAGITLGAAILSADPVAVLKAGTAVVDLIQKFRKEDDAAAKANREGVADAG